MKFRRISFHGGKRVRVHQFVQAIIDAACKDPYHHTNSVPFSTSHSVVTHPLSLTCTLADSSSTLQFANSNTLPRTSTTNHRPFARSNTMRSSIWAKAQFSDVSTHSDSKQTIPLIRPNTCPSSKSMSANSPIPAFGIMEGITPNSTPVDPRFHVPFFRPRFHSLRSSGAKGTWARVAP